MASLWAPASALFHPTKKAEGQTLAVPEVGLQPGGKEEDSGKLGFSESLHKGLVSVPFRRTSPLSLLPEAALSGWWRGESANRGWV